MNTKRALFVLVGPPSIGKTSWVDDHHPDAFLVSRDDCVDAVRKPLGLRYSDMFSPQNLSRFRKDIDFLFRENVRYALESDRDIVVDLTNMGVKARRRALGIIRGRESQFTTVAVVFDHRGKEQLVWESVQRRSKRINDKFVPRHILADMFQRFEMPTTSEGFDRVEFADTKKAIGA
jgi:predicted kinase